MDFNKLMARMRELDQPVAEAHVEECGEPMGMTPPMPSTPPTTPPSMSVNLNAQGMDNIESLLKLMTKVNPDMINQKAAPAPMLGTPPNILSIGGDDHASEPMKLLPDLDKDEEESVEPADDDIMNHLNKELKPFDDQQAKEKEDEGFVNKPEPEYGDIDSVLMKGNDLNKPKKTFSKVAGGDNPMQPRTESTDLRTQIRNELQRRLAEAKGAQ